MDDAQPNQIDLQSDVPARKVWTTPTLESVDFLDTNSTPAAGQVYDFGFYSNKSF